MHSQPTANQLLINQKPGTVPWITMIPPTETFEDFVAIVRQLRTDCPWDREQTHASIAPLIIEEAYEVKESILEENDQEFRKELGDILLHVVMHSVMAEEREAFSFEDVVQTIARKLVHRHPHVFGDEVAADPETVSKNWEQFKMQEGRTSIFDGMPKALPALQRAERVQEKASKVGFDWPDSTGVWEKVHEEVGEFSEAAQSGESQEAIEEEFGDLLFSLVNVARFMKILPEEALQRTTSKFIRRFRHVEQRVREEGKEMKETDLETMDAFWDEAKKLEKTSST